MSTKTTTARRRSVRFAVAGLVPAVLGLVALVPAAEAAAPPVHVASSSVGKILVNGKTMTVYMFARDSKGKSKCTGTCATNWPPVIVTSATVAAAPGVTAKLATIKRSDGKLQVTANGWPLYTFTGDSAKGQLNGQGVDAFGAKWWVLSPKGAKVTTLPTAGSGPSTTPTTPGGGPTTPPGDGPGIY